MVPRLTHRWVCVIIWPQRRGRLLENFGYVGLFLVAAVPFTVFMITLPILLRRFGSARQTEQP